MSLAQIAPFDAGPTRPHLRTCGRQVHYAPGVCFCDAIVHHEAGHIVAILGIGLRFHMVSVRGVKRYDSPAYVSHERIAEALRIVIEQESAVRRIGQALFRTPVMYEARIKALWSGKGGR